MNGQFDVSISCAILDAIAIGHYQEPLTDGGKLRPRHIAQAMELFPVPLGPKIMFRYGPGRNSTQSYVKKFLSWMRTIEPGTKLDA